jgi:hypothetical protein
VLVTRPVVEAAGPDVVFARIGEVRLKGFSEVTELFAGATALCRVERRSQASNVWWTASTLLPSGSNTNAP